MRNVVGSVLLLGAIAVTRLAAQTAPPPQGRFDAAFTYNPMRSNVVGSGGFWMQGASAQAEVRLTHGLGVAADIGGLHTGNINSSGVGLDMITYTFGPRYAWSPARHKVSFYGQGLVGGAHGFNGLFPHAAAPQASASSLAVLAGGGFDATLSPHLALRVIEADWLRTQLPNSTTGVQNNLRLGAGLVFHF